MPRRIFGSKGEEVMEGWRNLHNVIFTNFTPIKIILANEPRQITMKGHVARIGDRL
jgi:hypothetical protein